MSKPTLCNECAEPVWIVGARSLPDGHWEAALVCPRAECTGWAVYSASGRLREGHMGHGPMYRAVQEALEEKRRGLRLDRRRNGSGGFKPTLCVDCKAPLWIMGAHRFPKDDSWEVGMICPDPDCKGWTIFTSKGSRATNRTLRLKPKFSRTHDILLRALAQKESRQKEMVQKDEGDVRTPV